CWRVFQKPHTGNFVVTDQARHFLRECQRLACSCLKRYRGSISPTIHLTQLKSIAKSLIVRIRRSQCVCVTSALFLSRANFIGFSRTVERVVELSEGCKTIPTTTSIIGVSLVIVKRVPHLRPYVGRYSPYHLAIRKVRANKKLKVVLLQCIAFCLDIVNKVDNRLQIFCSVSPFVNICVQLYAGQKKPGSCL